MLDEERVFRRQAGTREDIVNALIGLGYNEREAMTAFRGLPQEITVPEGIRLALKALAKS